MQKSKPLAKTRIQVAKVPFAEILTMAAESLWNNRLRTALTMLGVIIGIAAVIAALDAAAATTGVGGHAEQIEVDQEGVRILRSVGVK